MKYATKFYQGFDSNLTDEIIIKYTEKTTSLLDFVQKHNDKTVILDVRESDEDLLYQSLDLFTAAASFKNFKIMLSYKKHSYFLTELQMENIPYFFNELALSWDLLNYFVYCGVSDVYVYGELCFDIQSVGNYCHRKDVKVRVVPNIIQSMIEKDTVYLSNNQKFKMFFIRPEDVVVYEPYIDVMQFECPLQKQETLIKIYKSGSWAANLNLLILGLDLEIDNRMIPPGWSEKRIKCKKRCNYNACKMCDSVIDLAKAMKDNNYMFKLEKVKTKGEKENEIEIDDEAIGNSTKEIALYDDRLSAETLQEDYSN